MTPQERLDAGILPGMLRLSIGLEGEQALFDDLRRALAQSDDRRNQPSISRR
jgi:methionine-gamma-lyase